MSISPKEALQRTIEHREIFFDEMISLMRQIMGGEISPLMTAAILAGLRTKKETIGEIAAAATVMRELSTKVTVPAPIENFLDVVGTGGDAAHSFNISTATIFVGAAAGERIALWRGDQRRQFLARIIGLLHQRLQRFVVLGSRDVGERPRGRYLLTRLERNFDQRVAVGLLKKSGGNRARLGHAQ